MSWSLLLSFVFFAAGVGMVIWATERLLEGLMGLAYLVRVSICHHRRLRVSCR